jgi:hypothetical protein
MWLDAETGDFAQGTPESLAATRHEVFFAATATKWRGFW